jgi:hypothetical protein
VHSTKSRRKEAASPDVLHGRVFATVPGGACCGTSVAPLPMREVVPNLLSITILGGAIDPLGVATSALPKFPYRLLQTEEAADFAPMLWARSHVNREFLPCI